jgi:multiple sugar transport system permease protein
MNSVIIGFGSTFLSIFLGTLAAYAFSRFEMPFKGALFFTILATQFIPAVVVVLPFYLLFRDLGLLDTHLALVIVNLAIVTPFAVWMLKGFLDAVPTESEEAALVDGATRLRVIIDIVVPMVWPGVLVTAVFCFILTWNEFLFALILTRDYAVTLPVGITRFRTERGDLWELIAAAGIEEVDVSLTTLQNLRARVGELLNRVLLLVRQDALRNRCVFDGTGSSICFSAGDIGRCFRLTPAYKD